MSFPGGYYGPGDRDLRETALREFKEEMGGDPSGILGLDCMATFRTHLKVPIIPWVAVSTGRCFYHPNPNEVAQVLYLPLERLIREGLIPVTVEVWKEYV